TTSPRVAAPGFGPRIVAPGFPPGRPPAANSLSARGLLETGGDPPGRDLQTQFPQKLKTCVQRIFNRKLHRLAATFAAGGAALSLFLSCSSFNGTVVAPPEIPGAHFVGNKA